MDFHPRWMLRFAKVQALVGFKSFRGHVLPLGILDTSIVASFHRGGESDVAKTLDFGLVKPTRDPGAESLTADLTVSGTPSYMAPEQASGGRDLDGRADLYALGAVAYFLLTGRPPFSGGGAFAIMMAHARDPVIPPSAIRPGLPADLEAVVLTCLAKRPEGRYPDARAMGRALADCEAAPDWDADRA